ncbi:DUF7738 domain-containing protein [Cesiribacter andamanensis]|uniref:DUF7738 domain-containing protein n=1 Tax=Cesiribacter andamanensis TaxID=649507 RepID=UPI00058FB1BB|nr:hypothetical protein [Cesiribacter andamanensis]
MAKNTISINESTFTQYSTIEDYERLLGKADRILQKRGLDHYFAYDQLGIALVLKKDSDVVGEVLITYLNDGDGKIAKEAYRGMLLVNNQPVEPGLSPKEIGMRYKLELVEVMNGFFLTPMQQLNLLFYYPQDVPHTRIKQFGVRFSGAVQEHRQLSE